MDEFSEVYYRRGAEDGTRPEVKRQDQGQCQNLKKKFFPRLEKLEEKLGKFLRVGGKYENVRAILRNLQIYLAILIGFSGLVV